MAGLFLALILLGGCAHSPGRIAQFDPAPPGEVDVSELESCLPAAVSDLLRQAEEELKLGNIAHEKGDQDTARTHYRKMFSLLHEAELDPSLNYASRELFERVLTAHLNQSHLYHESGSCLGKSGSEVYSDLIIPTDRKSVV